MKKYLGIIFILICSMPLYSQSSRLGVNLDILTGNKYLDYDLGPSLVYDYHFKNIPFSISGKTSLHISEFSNDNIFSTGYTRTDINVGIIVNYYPISWAIEPYIGAGAFFNINDITQSGSAASSIDGFIYLPSRIRNNLSAEINLGINFSAKSPINFVVEVSQTFNKPNYDLEISDTKGTIFKRITKTETFNFNSLFLRLGLYFKI